MLHLSNFAQLMSNLSTFVSSLFLLLNPFSKYPSCFTHHHIDKTIQKILDFFFLSTINFTNFCKLLPNFHIAKLKNKTIVTYSSQPLQNLIHVILHEVQIMESFSKLSISFLLKSK
jgi:hypothetical protein